MKRIFLVEDDRAITKNPALLLRSEGFTVTHASTYGEALVALVEHKSGLTLTDIFLPDGDGFTVCTETKGALGTLVIFLTISDDESDMATGLNMGASDYITKPFHPRELIIRIRTVLRKGGYSPLAFEVSKLHVDMADGIVKRSGNEVFLSALEYRLSLAFINNPKNITTRSRLLDELWDAASKFTNDNTLTVYIRRLRERIENNPANLQVTLTARGTGYRLGDGRVSK